MLLGEQTTKRAQTLASASETETGGRLNADPDDQGRAGRVGDRLATIAPDAEVVTVTAADDYELAGKPIDKDAIDPEVVWLSLDSYASGTMGALVGRLMKAQAPRWTQIMAAGIDNPIFKQHHGKGRAAVRSRAPRPPDRRICGRPCAQPAGPDRRPGRPAGASTSGRARPTASSATPAG